MIASHYAEPLDRNVIADAFFRAAPDGDAELIGTLNKGSVLRMLDCARGWAWGYGPDGRVGYVAKAALSL